MKEMTNYTGRAGEYRVLSELLLKGYNPALRSVDTGVDIVLEDGTTLQVKTVSKPNTHDTRTGYTISLMHTYYKKGKSLKKINSGQGADFLVAWLVDVNIFYIVPTKVLGNKVSLILNPSPKRKSKFEQYKNKWDLIRNGVS